MVAIHSQHISAEFLIYMEKNTVSHRLYNKSAVAMHSGTVNFIEQHQTKELRIMTSFVSFMLFN